MKIRYTSSLGTGIILVPMIGPAENVSPDLVTCNFSDFAAFHIFYFPKSHPSSVTFCNEAATVSVWEGGECGELIGLAFAGLIKYSQI